MTGPLRQSRPSITAAIVRGEGLGRTVTVDQDELVDAIRRLRALPVGTADEQDPGTISIGRSPFGDNHLCLGDGDRSISNLHVLVTPVEQDAVRISHCGRTGPVTITVGSSCDALAPGESRVWVLPVDLTFGRTGPMVALRHEDACPSIDDGVDDWDDLDAVQRAADNPLITSTAGVGLEGFCHIVRDMCSAQRVIVATRQQVLGASGGTPDDRELAHLWRWYAFNGRGYRLIRDLTVISMADGCSSALGHGVVVRLLHSGVYLHVLRSGTTFVPRDRERLARLAWYATGLNERHPEWFPRMHVEDHEPGHVRRLVQQRVDADPTLLNAGPAVAIQRLAPRLCEDAGIIFPRRATKKLSANAGLDVPRRHVAVAQASQSRYYHRLTDMLELFVTDLVAGVAPKV